MAEVSHKKTMAFIGSVSIAGAISMFIGAAFWGVSGTDLWQALASGQMETYLSQLPSVRHLLVINTCFWISGVLLLATAGSLMSGFCVSNPGLAQFPLVFIRAAAPMGIAAFIIMLSLSIHPPAVDSANNIGWIGTKLDDLATILIVGISPLFLSIAGRADWVPGWLAVWGYLAGITGLLGVIGMVTGIVALGFVIIPFGLGWMIAAGVVLIKKSKTVTG